MKFLEDRFQQGFPKSCLLISPLPSNQHIGSMHLYCSNEELIYSFFIPYLEKSIWRGETIFAPGTYGKKQENSHLTLSIIFKIRIKTKVLKMNYLNTFVFFESMIKYHHISPTVLFFLIIMITSTTFLFSSVAYESWFLSLIEHKVLGCNSLYIVNISLTTPSSILQGICFYLQSRICWIKLLTTIRCQSLLKLCYW